MELYQGEGVKEYSRRDMLKMLAGGAAGLAGLIIGGCAGTQKGKESLHLTLDMPYTWVLPDGNIICDLNGFWEMEYAKVLRNTKLKIGFDGKKFSARKRDGQELFKGSLNPSGIFETAYLWDRRTMDWARLDSGEIINCDEFVLRGWVSVKSIRNAHYTFTFKRYK